MVKNSSATKSAKKGKSTSKKPESRNSPEAFSSTTEVTKKIKKLPKPSIRPSHSKRSRSTEISSSEAPVCPDHGSYIEFMCQACFRELCGHCILGHSEHISQISSLKNIMKEYIEEGDLMITGPDRLHQEIVQTKSHSLEVISGASKKIVGTVEKYIEKVQSRINKDFEEATATIKNLAELKSSATDILEGHHGLTKENIELVKNYLNYSKKLNNNKPLLQPLNINQEALVREIENILESGFTFETFDTTAADIPKYLHWFEWGKRKLNIYNIITNTTGTVDLDIHFKIPSFSRSIMLPNGLIFLLGGEEPEYVSRKEVYMYDCVANDRKLHLKAPMLHKKFDFTLAYLNGCIYVICGKDCNSEVVDDCEKYSVEENTWCSIAPVRKKRYAASALGFSNNKVYLFGGRSDYNNMMVHDIEEYCAFRNEWTILNVKNVNLWNPVEVCACIQISEDQVLIFGGSDAQIKDSPTSLIFCVKDSSIEKRNDLKKAQVFVNSPFLYKNHVYALGNEYYMKHRNLHRFSIEKNEWDLIF